MECMKKRRRKCKSNAACVACGIRFASVSGIFLIPHECGTHQFNVDSEFPMSTTTERLIAGTAAGIIATVPMTALMLLLHRRLPARERYPLPPRKVTMEAAEDVGLLGNLSEHQRVGLTTAGHFAYGGGVGGLYTM